MQIVILGGVNNLILAPATRPAANRHERRAATATKRKKVTA